jgi:hypothetical protein
MASPIMYSTQNCNVRADVPSSLVRSETLTGSCVGGPNGQSNFCTRRRYRGATVIPGVSKGRIHSGEPVEPEPRFF